MRNPDRFRSIVLHRHQQWQFYKKEKSQGEWLGKPGKDLGIWKFGILARMCSSSVALPLISFPSFPRTSLPPLSVSCLSQQRLLPGLAAQLTKYLPSTLDQCSALFLSISKTTVIQVLHIQGQFKEIIIIKNYFWKRTFCSFCLFVSKLNFPFVFRIDHLQGKANHRPDLWP